MRKTPFIFGRIAATALALVCTAAAVRAADAYVESLKANTIFTDYYAKPTTRIDLDFEWLAGEYGDASVQHGGMVIGPWSSGCGTATAFWNAGGANGMQFIVGSDRKFVNSGSSIAAARWFISIDGHTGKLQLARHGAATTNEVASGAAFAANANWPVSLLGSSMSTDGSAVDGGQFAKARIYGCKIYEWIETSGSYDLVRDYVPVLRDGVPCLRDTVTDTFAVDPRSGAAALGYGGDIEEVGGGYIQSVADVGLDTGYKMKAESRVELDCALASASAVVRPMGCWNGGASTTLRELVWTSGSKVIFFVNNNQQSTGLSIDTGRHTYVIDQKNAKGRYVTGVTVMKEVTGASAAAGTVSSLPLAIFADTSGTAWAQPATGMKCYGLKIYESGVLVTNFVPYVRNGEIGFRDTLTGAFLSASAGTTNFVAGGNIALSGPTARDAFVQSDGTQILNTGYHVGNDSRIEVDLAVLVPAKGFLFGNFASGAGLRWCAWQNSASGPLRFSGGSVGSNTDIVGGGLGTLRTKLVYDVKNAQGWIERDGSVIEKKSITASSLAAGATCAYPMGVFGSLKNANGTEVDTSISPAMTVMRVYSVRIYESDELAAEFLPYAGAEGVGLYDTKTGNVALKHSASVAEPAIGGMGVDGAEKWLVSPPSEIVVPADGTATVSAKAVGKVVRYAWTLGGETVEGATGDSLEIAWRSGTHGEPVAGSVTAFYEVFGTETAGEPVPFMATFNPTAFVMVVR